MGGVVELLFWEIVSEAGGVGWMDGGGSHGIGSGRGRGWG